MSKISVDPPSIFSVPSSSALELQPRKVKDRKIDSESRPLVTQKGLEQVDTISSEESLTEFCHELNVTAVNKNDFIILVEIAEIPPGMFFSLKIFKTIQYLVS